jgi:hypothetical protein
MGHLQRLEVGVSLRRMITGVKSALSCDSFATETVAAALLTRLKRHGFNAAPTTLVLKGDMKP